jgi:tetratricopeptide (TPR) repeat protein
VFRGVLLTVVCALVLAACAGNPVTTAPAHMFWQDEAFDYEPVLVKVTREDLFRLDDELQQKLREADGRNLAPSQRVRLLLAEIFGPDLRQFAYQAGHSTTAAETWRKKRGDCLSLTVLTYAAARALNMDAQMQDVPIPTVFDRRNHLDALNQHVNLVFRRVHRNLLEDPEPRDVIVDFEPEFASRRLGRPLDENAVLARYYNNSAAEHLAKGERALAYAHFKASILADPSYAAAYSNLAVLYIDAGLVSDAEHLLHRAIEIAEQPDVPLYTLYHLLADQGRNAEAQRYAQRLELVRERDPYHWIGLGVRDLGNGSIRGAINALERAREMASGFDEVHRYLAIAYMRAGEVAKAKEEIAALASLPGNETSVALLRRKMTQP